MNANLSVDAGILAGGLSRRFGGKHKGLVSLDGKAMIEHVLDRLQPFVDKVFISANDQEAYQGLNCPIVNDLRPQYPGPLAGLEALLSTSTADYLLIVPCDSPSLPQHYAKDMLTRLLKLGTDEPRILALEHQGKQHPLHLCIHRSYLSSIQSALDTDERRVMRWINSLSPTWCDFGYADSLRINVNSPEDLPKF